MAESGELEHALELLNKAVQTAPRKASCYNNRAQALQISGKTDGTKCIPRSLALLGTAKFLSVSLQEFFVRPQHVKMGPISSYLYCLAVPLQAPSNFFDSLEI